MSDKEAKPIKQFDFYEFAGLLAPGSVLLVGLSLIYPDLKPLVLKSETSVGDLGLFVILAYVAGHLVQSVSNALELLYLKVIGGEPSTWIFDRPSPLGQDTKQDRLKLSPLQIATARAQLSPKLGLTFGGNLDDELAALSPRARSGMVRQMHSVVTKAGRAERLEKFAANYGLFRALSAALLVLVGLMLLNAFTNAKSLNSGILVAMFAAVVAALARMHRFSKLYAEQLTLEFLQASTDSPSLTPSSSAPLSP